MTIKREKEAAETKAYQLELNLETLLKNGVHYGHHKSHKHPKMEEYINSIYKGICIINLEKTLEKTEEAMNFLKEVVKKGHKVLFVGTQKQAQDLVKTAALDCGMPYVEERWLGGTLTNFPVIKKRAQYLKNAQEAITKGDFEKYTKFEQTKKKEEIEKLEKKMGGIKEMVELPGAVFVVDVKNNTSALKEAAKMNIPTLSLVDTNIDPSLADYIIPANDDAIYSLKTMLGFMVKAILEVKKSL